MIALDHVTKSFDNGRSFAVKDLSLSVREGETLVLLGSSGCGKTTTLKMINRLITPTDGIISIDGRDVRDQNPVKLRRSIGYVFQGIGLFPHMTVRQNVEAVLRLKGCPARKRRDRADALLSLMELPAHTFADRLPEALSGGQKQRVGVARALAADPRYLLMDEPFGALDALIRDELQKAFLRLKRQLNKTVIFVTHDLFEALALGDRIAILHKGCLQQVGTRREMLAHPETRFVRDLFGKPAGQLAAFKEYLS